MMIPSIIFISALFSDLFSDLGRGEYRGLLSGRVWASQLWSGVWGTGHVTPGGGVLWPGGATLHTGSGCWISWSWQHSSGQRCRECGHREGCLQCYSRLTQGDSWNNTGCVTWTGPEYAEQGECGVSALAVTAAGPAWLETPPGLAVAQSGAGIQPAHTNTVNTVWQVININKPVIRMLPKFNVFVTLLSKKFISVTPK